MFYPRSSCRNFQLLNDSLRKVTVEVPMLGSIIENSGDALDESHMPLGWPLSIDGAVRQFCSHKTATIQELDKKLEEYDMKRSSVEINRNASQWSHNSVWNRKYMEPIKGYTLQQMWRDAEAYISKKTTRSSDVSEEALRRNVWELNSLPRASSPDSLFLQDLGKPNRGNIPSAQSAGTKQWLSWNNCRRAVRHLSNRMAPACVIGPLCHKKETFCARWPFPILPTAASVCGPALALCTGEDRLWESKFYIPFQPQKWASNKSNSSVTSSCASCGFLQSRLESQS